MKTLLNRVDPLQFVALALLGLPTLALFGFGMLWLWQTDHLVTWLIVMVVCGGLAYGLQIWSAQRRRKLLNELFTEPNPDWPPRAADVWQEVEALADSCDPQDWPLDHTDWIIELGKRTLHTVSRCYFPDAERPLLELTVPHTLLIIEQASRDLRRDVTENIPFSDRLTLGDLIRAKRWKTKAEKAYNVYRAGRIVANPVNALFGEFWRLFRERSFTLARSEFQRWFLRAYIRKVGYYAIDLYSRRQPLAFADLQTPAATPPLTSALDLERARQAENKLAEPLHILVLGRTNAGKSSLINALYGKLIAATDILPDTTYELSPALLQRDGFTQALIYDSPGCDSGFYDDHQMQTAALEADLILWVTPANRPDRQIERRTLDALRTAQSACLNRRPPPLLVAVSHIDLLRPANEWQPPYDLTDQLNVKATNIRAAVAAVAADLSVPVTQVIPVCLKEEKVYNVKDAFWAAMLAEQDTALRVRLLRCLDADKRTSDWALLRRQLRNAGRFLWELPDKIKE
ncbi:GTPase family protein [Nitrosomonas sp. ANs5]|uniref:GTPase family protein n=1 Tax=Nitrosomonas sp. ANs5 TaxID=3423941 RepID=UPI003D3565FD